MPLVAITRRGGRVQHQVVDVCPSCNGLATLTIERGAWRAHCPACGAQKWRAAFRRQPPAVVYTDSNDRLPAGLTKRPPLTAEG